VSGLGWLAGGVVAALLLAGCSGDEPAAEPPPLKAPTTSPVATESPTTPEPPVLPAAARENTKAGAVAFAHHYIDLINYATATGQSDGLLRASGAKCGACRETGRFIDRVYADGGFIRGGNWHPRSYSIVANGRASWIVAVQIDANTQKFRPKFGAPTITRTGGNYTVALASAWRHRRWIIDRMSSTK
jgi:hypothetical protein